MHANPQRRSSKRNVRQTPVWGYGYRYEDAYHGVQDNHAFYTDMQRDITRLWGLDGQNISTCGYLGQSDACGKDSVFAQWQSAASGKAGPEQDHPGETPSGSTGTISAIAGEGKGEPDEQTGHVDRSAGDPADGRL